MWRLFAGLILAALPFVVGCQSSTGVENGVNIRVGLCNRCGYFHLSD